MRVTSTSLRVRYYETDQMGIVHHSNYIRWFEVGRTDLLRQLGTNYRMVEEKGLLLPVIHMDCHYKQPALYDDLVEIRTSIAEYSGVRITFAYEIIRDGQDLVSGSSAHCWTKLNMKPTHMKKVWPELHQKIERFLDTS